MRKIDTYIIEKLKLNKDTKSNIIDPDKYKLLTDFFKDFFDKHPEAKLTFREIKSKKSENLMINVFPKKHGVSISEVWNNLKEDFNNYITKESEEIQNIIKNIHISPIQKYHVSICLTLK